MKIIITITIVIKLKSVLDNNIVLLRKKTRYRSLSGDAFIFIMLLLVKKRYIIIKFKTYRINRKNVLALATTTVLIFIEYYRRCVKNFIKSLAYFMTYLMLYSYSLSQDPH